MQKKLDVEKLNHWDWLILKVLSKSHWQATRKQIISYLKVTAPPYGFEPIGKHAIYYRLEEMIAMGYLDFFGKQEITYCVSEQNQLIISSWINAFEDMSRIKRKVV